MLRTYDKLIATIFARQGGETCAHSLVGIRGQAAPFPFFRTAPAAPGK